MGDLCLNLNDQPNEDGFEHYVLLKKDKKNICRMKCSNMPVQMPQVWSIYEIHPKSDDLCMELSKCYLLFPAPEDTHQQKECKLFLDYLKQRNKVATGKVDLYEFFIHPPPEDSQSLHALVSIRMLKARTGDITSAKRQCTVVQPSTKSSHPCLLRLTSNTGESRSPDRKFREVIGRHHANEYRAETCSTEPNAVGKNGLAEKHYARTDPSYLKTLGQAHSGWIFGAVAELVDNSRDAKATTLKISIDLIYSRQTGKEIPMLSVIDDGHGMTHEDVLRMISFGHKQPDDDDPDHIGRFGVGFKTGAMRLGKDALVITQTSNSRSIAFLSQSLNEGNDNLEIPIVSYIRKGQYMEVDPGVQTEASAKYNLRSIKEFSPFDKFLIGIKVGIFEEKGTGTQIYIWNLDEWGSDYCLEWVNGISGGSSFHKGDILIRSRRCRSRPGQMARKVQLDFSLRAYLEVIFLDPRIKIFVQGSMVQSRPLAKSLNKTVVEYGYINGKPVQLTLGRCQLEWEQANCGIFLYWHGRLIEAYKRVGGMIHNGDKSHGIIGVIDVTELMNDGNGRVWVHNNKQGFLDCEVYAQLEEWLGKLADEYLDNNLDKVQVRKGSSFYKPDHEWVQCNKCRKWRMLNSDFDSKTLPHEWFCFMKPFNGSCEMPEHEVERGVITISAKRSGCEPKGNSVELKDDPQGKASITLEDSSSEDDSSQTVEAVNPPLLKRLRRGPTRSCKKNLTVFVDF